MRMSIVPILAIGFRYYNPLIHRAAFALPTFQAEELAPYLTPIVEAQAP